MQGNIPGPLLFLLNINDLIKLCVIFLFADNTKLACTKNFLLDRILKSFKIHFITTAR